MVTTPVTAESVATTTTTTTTIPTTTTAVITDPLTAGEVTDAQLVLMTLGLEGLGDDYQGFEEVSIATEANLELARKTLQDPSDEADDIASFGRSIGARAVLRPRSVRVGAGDIASLHSWVSLFDTDEGASAYLADFVRDAAKGIGGGIPDDLAVTQAESFALDAIGSETVGLLLTEDVGDGFSRYQTLVVVRVGRILGFVAIVHPDEGDRRLRVIQLAEILNERIKRVLGGELVPPEPPPVLVPLVAYRFEYRQTVDKGPTDATIVASGVDVVGEALDCRLVFDLQGLSNDRQYVIVGDNVQILDRNAPEPVFETTSRDAFNTAIDLIYCPGWPIELLASGLDVILAGQPIVEVTHEGEPAIMYTLDAAAAASIGFIPEGSPIDVDRFEVIVDAVNPWTRSLVLDLSGSARQFADAFGDEFTEFAGNSVTVSIEFTASDINDPTLEVIAP